MTSTARQAWGFSALVAALVALPTGALALLSLWFAEADRAAALQSRRHQAQTEAQDRARAAMAALEDEARRLAESAGEAFLADGASGLRRFYLTEPTIAAVTLAGPAQEPLFPRDHETLLFGEDRLLRQAAPRLEILRAQAVDKGSVWSGTPRETAAPALHCRSAPPGVVCLLLRPAALEAFLAQAAEPARLTPLEAADFKTPFGLLPEPFAGFALTSAPSPDPGRSPLALALLLAPTLLGSAAAGVFALRAHRMRLKAAQIRIDALAEVSHDLRTPLANLRLYADLLRRAEGRPEKIARYAAVVEEETARLSRLVDGALTAVSEKPPALETLSPDALARSLLERYGPSFAAAPPLLDAGCPEPARFDAKAFERILLNLLDNARKYAPGAAVTIVTRRAPGELRLTVSDAGSGEGAREPPEGAGGFGLGLKACAALARQAGGAFEAEIGPKGARFSLRLPDHRGAEP